MKTVKLRNYDNSWYESGGALKRVAWYFVNMIFFSTMLPFPSGFKVRLLRLFGAEEGEKIVSKIIVLIQNTNSYAYGIYQGNPVQKKRERTIA